MPSMLSKAEYQQILIEWNDTTQGYPCEATLHTLFGATVSASPNAIAVSCAGESLSYQELDCRANQLAHRLVKEGVQPETLVGLCIDRSIDMLVGVLGVLKSGGAYVPLDPADPKDRLSYMLADSKAPVLVTQSSLQAYIPETDASVVCVDTLGQLVDADNEAPEIASRSSHLAYVIYTSGSTGKPKGVQLEHRSVVNFLTSMQQQPGLTRHDRLLAVTTLSFDISVLELLLPLITGATVVIATREEALDGCLLKEKVVADGITVMQATPATWRLLLQAGWQGKQHMQAMSGENAAELTVLCGGEALQRDLAQQLHSCAAAVWNMYGLTETTIWSSCERVDADDELILVGRPIANTRMYVLDAQLSLVPAGIVGDLFIGGEGLARGYHDRPELTAERFIDDPYAAPSGSVASKARMYRTGDLACFMPDGRIQVLGRAEVQVKSRGFRMAPRDETEKQLVDIWQVVLQQKRVGIHDDFFALGGHSLLAMQLVSRIRNQLGIDIGLRDLFKSPTIALLGKALPAARKAAVPAILPYAAGADGALLSFAQERLWFLAEFDPGTPAYNIPWVLKLQGALNLPAMQMALNQLTARHPSLRTVFSNTEQGPLQRILDSVSIQPKIISGKGLSPDQLQRRLRRLSQLSFNLAQGPLLRAHIIHLEEGSNILLLTLHHIVCDNWSIGLLQSDLSALYNAALQGEKAALTPPALTYIDYSMWQRQLLDGDVLQQQLDYWTGHLADAPALIELPTDKPRPVVQTFNGSCESRVLGSDLSVALHSLACGEQATLFMLLLPSFGVLLSRYTSNDDVVIGTPISGRSDPKLEGIIGIFLNTLALRCDLSGNPTFRDLLKRTRQNILDGYSNQDLPFETLVDEMQPSRDMSHSPLFQVMFTLNNAGPTTLELDGLQISAVGFDYGTAKFDLNLSMTDTPQGLGAYLEYNTDLFERSTIERMLNHFELLLHSIVANPDCRVANLRLLDKTERRRLISEFNPQAIALSGETTIHGLIEAACNAHTTGIALDDGQWRLTYAELNSYANVLARELQRRGIGNHSAVAISCERSIEMVVSVLAVLKAGAAYVPVDPFYPADRIGYMLSDSQAVLVLTQRRLHDGLVADTTIPLLCIDEFDFRCADDSNLNVVVSPDDAVYNIYTSGSTGQPKGVVLTHAGLCNLIKWQSTEQGLNMPARTLQFASLSFDVSFQELFSTWAQGGTVVMITEELRKDLPALAELISERQIERLYLPFAALQPLADILADRADLPLALNDIISAGEQLQITPAIRSLFKRGVARLHNHYGPSETHVVTTLTLSGDPEVWPARPTIGHPISNTRCYILDTQGEPAPIGVPGELYLAGIQVAREYLDRPELNAEKFIADPFSTNGTVTPVASRMYRTGDRARFLDNGEIEYLGRIDNQIKLSGFRIELGEIETVLIEHSDVRQGVVVLREDNQGDQRLVAYVKLVAGSEVDTAVLREYLKTNLPDYMVPSALMVLDVIPLMPTGKVDRNALPAPDYTGETEYLAPRDETEQQLVDIWQAVLHIELIGVDDNFFDLGGRSLLAITLISRIQKELDPTAKLWMIFSYPTIAEFAVQLGSFPSLAGIAPVGSIDAVPHPALMSVNLTGTHPPLFCVYGEPALLASKLSKDRPVYSLNTACGEGGIAAAPSNINEAAHIYIEAIRSVQPTGPYFLYGHCSGATIAYEIARLLLAGGDDVSHVCLLEPSINGRGLRHTAVMMILGIRSNGFSVVRLKALLSVTRELLRVAPAFAGNNLQFLWHSLLGTLPSLRLRLISHQTKVAPSVNTYVYQELGCSVSFIYRNLDEVQSSELKQFWSQVVGHEVRVHSVEAGAEHLAVLEAGPLKTTASLIDASVEEECV